jgi:hypothetical protein
MKVYMKIKKVIVPGILLIMLSVSCLLFVNSRWGIGVTHDSIFYLSSAGNLVNHNGLQWSASDGSLHPLTHFPPLYSLFISLIMVFGIPDTMAATWLAAILLGLNVFTAGYLVYHFSRSMILSILAALSLAVATGFINLHLIALSEPLFIWMILCSIGALGVYFEKPSRKLLLLAAFLAALSVLTRYVGLAVVATCFLAIAAIERTPFRTRIVHLLIYLTVSLSPILLWIVRNLILVGSTTNRMLIYHPLDWGNRKLGFETISGWFTWAPVSYKATITFSGLFLGIVFFWWLWLGWKLLFSQTMKSNWLSGLRFVFMLNLFSLVYLASIFFSLTFYDASIRLDGRILAPVYISFLLALFTMLGSLSFRWQWISGILCAFFIVLNLPATINSWSDLVQNGKGFTSQSWQTSKAVAYVRNVAPGSAIYSNQGMALYFLTSRPVHEIPEKMDVVRNVVRDDYPAQMKLMADDLSRPGSFIVWFAGGGLSDSVLKETKFDLQVYKAFPDATILANSENVQNKSLP